MSNIGKVINYSFRISGDHVPIFNDLMPSIEDAHELSVGKGEHLIHRYRDAESNLRTQLHRIIKRPFGAMAESISESSSVQSD